MNTKKYHSSAIRRFGQQKTLLKHIHRSERQAAIVDSPAYQAHTFNGGGICSPITDTVTPLNSWSPFLNRSHRLSEKYMASKGNAVGEINKVLPEKTAELTLPVIRLKKEINVLPINNNT